MIKKISILFLSLIFILGVFAKEYKVEKTLIDYEVCLKYFEKGKTLLSREEGGFIGERIFFVYDEELFSVDFRPFHSGFNLTCYALKI